MRRVTLPLFLFAATLARAGGSMEQLCDDETLLSDERRDVYAVEVVKVDDAGATQEHPPRVTFKVLESLRGPRKEGEEFEALWMPVQHDIDYVGGDAAERLKLWNETPMKGPEKGKAFVVMGQLVRDGGTFQVSFRCRFEDSEAARADVRRMMKEGRERIEASKRAEKEHKAAVAKRREEDAAALEKIDVAAAAKAAPVVMVGCLTGFERSGGETRLLFGFHKVLKGDGIGTQSIFELQMSPSDDDLLTLEARATDEENTKVAGLGPYPNVIVFLNAPSDPKKPCDLAPVAGLASIVPATPERVKAVREALGLPEPEK